MQRHLWLKYKISKSQKLHKVLDKSLIRLNISYLECSLQKDKTTLWKQKDWVEIRLEWVFYTDPIDSVRLGWWLVVHYSYIAPLYYLPDDDEKRVLPSGSNPISPSFYRFISVSQSFGMLWISIEAIIHCLLPLHEILQTVMEEEIHSLQKFFSGHLFHFIKYCHPLQMCETQCESTRVL